MAMIVRMVMAKYILLYMTMTLDWPMNQLKLYKKGNEDRGSRMASGEPGHLVRRASSCDIMCIPG